MRLPRQRKAQAVIPTASMADIAFLLIIFFMVTTVHQIDRTKVALPGAVEYTEAEKPAAIVVVYSDDATGELVYKFSDGDEMSTIVSGPDAIYLEASRLTYRDPQLQFALKADGDLKFALIDELMDQLRRGGVQNLLLLTQPKGEDSSS